MDSSKTGIAWAGAPIWANFAFQTVEGIWTWSSIKPSADMQVSLEEDSIVQEIVEMGKTDPEYYALSLLERPKSLK